MDPVTSALTALLHRHADRPTEGVVADYIPELAVADPDAFAMSMVSVHGHVYEAGDVEQSFTIQSVSKPFVYALALGDLGLEAVAARIGFEPSGEPFNAISLEPDTGRPANALINAGAIVTTSMIPGTPQESFERIHAGLSAFAGRDLEVDEAVYRSEAATGDRNRALGYLTLAQGVLARPAEEATDVYFRQCSLLVTATDLAIMAATLANMGLNPVTRRRVVEEDVVRTTLSVMATCGMYDHSGEWMVRVGLPAKSGVGGGIAAVLPSELGIGVFSPPLDEQGNSVRGMAALEEMSQRLGLHMFMPPGVHRSPIAASKVDGERLTIALRGELDFVAAEGIGRHLQEMAATYPITEVDLDVTDVTTVRSVAADLLQATGRDLLARGVRVVPSDREKLPEPDVEDEAPGERSAGNSSEDSSGEPAGDS
jgi:glutaminase